MSNHDDKWKRDMEQLAAWWKGLKPIVDVLLKESNDALEALVLGVFAGESAREKAENLGGKVSWPEKLAFEIGLAGSEILKVMLLDWLKSGLGINKED